MLTNLGCTKWLHDRALVVQTATSSRRCPTVYRLQIPRKKLLGSLSLSCLLRHFAVVTFCYEHQTCLHPHLHQLQLMTTKTVFGSPLLVMGRRSSDSRLHHELRPHAPVVHHPQHHHHHHQQPQTSLRFLAIFLAIYFEHLCFLLIVEKI